MERQSKKRRYQKTLHKGIIAPASIFYLGTLNAFSEIMKQDGFHVINTKGEDLDETPEFVEHIKADATTAFEIFEYLLNPLGVLKAIQTEKLFVSIPLSLWFAKAYCNRNNLWDQHFHEFEDWQFDWSLEKAEAQRKR